MITAAYVPLPTYHNLFPDSVTATQLLVTPPPRRSPPHSAPPPPCDLIGHCTLSKCPSLFFFSSISQVSTSRLYVLLIFQSCRFCQCFLLMLLDVELCFCFRFPLQLGLEGQVLKASGGRGLSAVCPPEGRSLDARRRKWADSMTILSLFFF